MCSSSTTRTRRARCSRLAVRLVATSTIFVISMYLIVVVVLIITTIIIVIINFITLNTIGPDSKSLYKLEQRDFTGVVDLTWGGWRKMQNLSE